MRNISIATANECSFILLRPMIAGFFRLGSQGAPRLTTLAFRVAETPSCVRTRPREAHPPPPRARRDDRRMLAFGRRRGHGAGDERVPAAPERGSGVPLHERSEHAPTRQLLQRRPRVRRSRDAGPHDLRRDRLLPKRLLRRADHELVVVEHVFEQLDLLLGWVLVRVSGADAGRMQPFQESTARYLRSWSGVSPPPRPLGLHLRDKAPHSLIKTLAARFMRTRRGALRSRGLTLLTRSGEKEAFEAAARLTTRRAPRTFPPPSAKTFGVGQGQTPVFTEIF